MDAEDYSISDTASESQSAGAAVQESRSELSAAGSNILIVYFSRHGISDGSYDTDADAVSSATAVDYSPESKITREFLYERVHNTIDKQV